MAYDLKIIKGTLYDGVGHGVLQAVNDFNLERDGDQFETEWNILMQYARAAGGAPFSLSLMQRDFAPDQWQRIIAAAEDALLSALDFVVGKTFRLGDNPDCEQTAETSVLQMAEDAGVPTLEMIYDLMLENNGRELLYFPIYNYTEMNFDNVLTMMKHPLSMQGLSDGGAHVGTVCDSSFSTYLLQAASGYSAVIVSGELVLENDRLTDVRPGHLVRLQAA